MLFLISATSVIDRSVIGSLGQAIKTDLQLTDLELGWLNGLGFALLYVLLGLPLARLAERSHRVRIIAASVAFFSMMSLLCGAATGFFTLLLARAGVGVGEAGVQPSAMSLLGDHYAPSERAFPITLISLGIPFGALLGAAGAGYLAQAYGWRIAFMAISAPGLVLAALAFFTLREPVRTLATLRPGLPPATFSAVLRHLWPRRAFRHLALAIALAGMANAAISAFIAPFYMRVYGLDIARAGLLFGLVAVTSGGVGMAFSGFGAGWLARRSPSAYGLVAGCGALISVPFYSLAFSAPDPFLGTAFFIGAAVTSIFYFAPSITMLQNMVQPGMQAYAAFIFSFITGLIGSGLGPVLLGGLSDGVAAAAFGGGDYAALCTAGAKAGVAEGCVAAGREGLAKAAFLIPALWTWAGIHYLLAARHAPADMAGEALEAPAKPHGSSSIAVPNN